MTSILAIYLRWCKNMKSVAVELKTPTTTMFLENKTYRMLFASSLVAILYMWAPDKEIDQQIVSTFIN